MCGPVSGRCVMWTAFIVFLAIWPLLVEAESNLLYEYTNGWSPVSNEVVYNQIKRAGAQLPLYTVHNIQLLHTDVNKALPPKILNKPEERIEPNTKDNKEKLDDDCFTSDILNCNGATFFNESMQEAKYEFVPDEYYDSTIQNETDYKPVRRSKKVADSNFKNDLHNLFLPENTSPKSKEKTYEVTEDTLELERSKTSNEGYNYESPKKKNQTRGLFEILSKYKINKDDELPNYVLSRRHKALIPSKPPEQPQNQIFHRYNNLNHLSVDPLLAVFLSNYGFYLQGMYGVHNHYNNLYGYLASNNIHNNRPFGVYKIYSDTDSSH